MAPRQISPGVYWVGAIDWERRLFDGLIPLPDGTSYNAYLIIGSEKIALIDTVDPTKQVILLKNLETLGIASIDYLIVNHAEQDHSGAIPLISMHFPRMKIVTNQKCVDLLQALLLLKDDAFVTIKDGDTLTLGDKTLEFIAAPWVHWPETMLTYLREDKILFTCDLFGSHIATSNLYALDVHTTYDGAKRYYAEIMMPFRQAIHQHMERIQTYQIDVIAPSHGPVWHEPQQILNAYARWISDRMDNEVIIPYVSMHGSTAWMVSHLCDALIKRGITVKPFDLTVTDIGELAKALVGAATIVIGTPTVLFGPHPKVVFAAYLVNALRPKAHYVSIIGSYGWGGKTVKAITEMLSSKSFEFLDPVIVRGYPKYEDLTLLDRLADQILEKHTSDALVTKENQR